MANIHDSDFNGAFSQTYQESCKCGQIITLSSQEDDRPEYYHTVFVKCKCGNSVKFCLPVN